MIQPRSGEDRLRETSACSGCDLARNGSHRETEMVGEDFAGRAIGGPRSLISYLICSALVPKILARSYFVMYGVVIFSLLGPAPSPP